MENHRKFMEAINNVVLKDTVKYIEICDGDAQQALAMVAMMLEYFAVVLDVDILDIYDGLKTVACGVKENMGDMRDVIKGRKE